MFAKLTSRSNSYYGPARANQSFEAQVWVGHLCGHMPQRYHEAAIRILQIASDSEAGCRAVYSYHGMMMQTLGLIDSAGKAGHNAGQQFLVLFILGALSDRPGFRSEPTLAAIVKRLSEVDWSQTEARAEHAWVLGAFPKHIWVFKKNRTEKADQAA